MQFFFSSSFKLSLNKKEKSFQYVKHYLFEFYITCTEQSKKFEKEVQLYFFAAFCLQIKYDLIELNLNIGATGLVRNGPLNAIPNLQSSIIELYKAKKKRFSSKNSSVTLCY